MRAVSWALAVLAAVALMVSVVAAFATREVFDADGFAARTEQALERPVVRAEVARRLTDAAISSQPDLVAIRPLVMSVAEGVVSSSAFGALVRSAVRDVHRSAFDSNATTVTLTVVDAGMLLAKALDRLRPELAARVPDELRVAVTDTASGVPLEIAQTAQDVRRVEWIALLAALLLGAAAMIVGTRAAPRGAGASLSGAGSSGGVGADSGGAASSGAAAAARTGGAARLVVAPSRDAVLRLGAAISGVAGVIALVATVAPRVLTGDAAARAVIETWTDPLALRCWVIAGAALLVTTAAASLWRPPSLAVAFERGRALLARVPRPVHALAAIALGVAALAEPLVVARVLVMVAGALAIVWGTSEVLRSAAPAGAAPVQCPHRRRISLRPLAVAVVALLATGGATAFALSGGADPVLVGMCNGRADLCDKRLDQVAFVGTHNSMSADGEPGWLFPAQNASIGQQLDDGVRALLIDTHYGFQTPRGVATDLEHDSISRAKIEGELGPAFVDTAQRLRARIGYNGGGTREVFLCHAFCEVGATRAVDALEAVHEFLVEHPEEVLIISIEDDTEPADTAQLFRDSGLIREVYTGPAGPPWPTLRTLIERNERVLVLIENNAGEEPWMHRQDELMQETPFHFSTAAALEADDSCRPNRGGTAGSLLLVNHWVDTSPAPRKSIARVVNAPAVLGTRLERCQKERGMLPTIVAVDFYADGDVFDTVDKLR